jgi:hypothetical protein
MDLIAAEVIGDIAPHVLRCHQAGAAVAVTTVDADHGDSG